MKLLITNKRTTIIANVKLTFSSCFISTYFVISDKDCWRFCVQKAYYYCDGVIRYHYHRRCNGGTQLIPTWFFACTVVKQYISYSSQFVERVACGMCMILLSRSGAVYIVQFILHQKKPAETIIDIVQIIVLHTFIPTNTHTYTHTNT